MRISFYTPRLIIRNISQKAVAIYDEYRIQPGEQVDIYNVFNPMDLDEDRVLKSLEKPWGDLYQEVAIKGSLQIVDIDLPSFHYNIVSPTDIDAVNAPGPGLVPSYLSDDKFEWISASSVSVASPLVLIGDTISIPVASGTQDGYLSKEDYAMFMAGVKRQQKIWQYQDFTSPVSTSITLSSFQNGTGLTFESTYIVPDSAVIVLTSDESKPPTTTITIPGRWLPGNRVSVSAHTGTTVILDQLPHTSLNCRVWFLISLPSAIPAPVDYIEAPQFVAGNTLATLDDLYLNQEGNETVYGIKTFENQSVFTSSIKIPLGAIDGYVLTSDALGNSTWQIAPGASSGITASEHADIDDLIHNLAEDYYEEYTYSGSTVTNITVWSDAFKILKIRETQFAYVGSKVVQEINIQYDSGGSEVQRLTSNYTYSGSRVVSVSTVETA